MCDLEISDREAALIAAWDGGYDDDDYQDLSQWGDYSGEWASNEDGFFDDIYGLTPLRKYEIRLKGLQFANLSCSEFEEKMAELQAEYLAHQFVPDSQKAIALIVESQQRGELPELDAPVSLDDFEGGYCQLLELIDNGRPDNRHWRCELQGCTIDVLAETGEVNLIWC